MTIREKIHTMRRSSLIWLLLVGLVSIVMILVWIKTVQQGEQITGKDRQGVDVPYH